MFIEFSVSNFLSFKNRATFSLVASKLKELQDNLFQTKNSKLNLLKSAVIYGANASGKSNLFKAMKFMKSFILNSSKETQFKEPIPVERFIFCSECDSQPASFEIIFLIDGIRYRYGFETDNAVIHKEWLFNSPRGRERTLFKREFNEIHPTNYFKEGKGLEDKTRANALFLSVVAQFNGEISESIFKWLLNFNIIMGIQDKAILPYTLELLNDESFKSSIIKFVKIADIQIEDIKREKIKFTQESLPKDIPVELRDLILNSENFTAITTHVKYDNDNKKVGIANLPLGNESDGTQKILSLSAPIIDTLSGGKVLLIDEMDARLHPLITTSIIKLFNSLSNKSDSQLVIATHDTNLLNNKLYRRDQIWFTEKDRYGSSDLYSLNDYKVRNDASYEKDYIMGKYGAVPFIGDFSSLIN